jgi:hypothetical protein
MVQEGIILHSDFSGRYSAEIWHAMLSIALK